MSLRDFKLEYDAKKYSLTDKYIKAKEYSKMKLASAPDKEDCMKLQIFLQNNIYGSQEEVEKLLEKSAFLAKQINNEGNQEKVSIILDKMKKNLNVGIGKPQEGETQKVLQYLTADLRKINAKNGIEKNSLQMRINRLKEDLNKLRNFFSKDKYEIFIKELNKLDIELNKILNNNKIQNIKMMPGQEEDMDYEALINTYNNIIDGLLKEPIPTDTWWGTAAEYLYVALSKEFLTLDKEEIAENIADNLVETIKKVATGYGESSFIKSAITEHRHDTKVKGKLQANKILTLENFYSDKNNTNKKHLEIKVNKEGSSSFNPLAAEQRLPKMDINFTFPEVSIENNLSKNYRISLKTRNTNVNFESDLAYSLVRIYDYDTLYAYTFQVGAYKNLVGKRLIGSRQVAKSSIILDALLGITQETGYADTLVIDNKQGKIEVYSLKEVVNILDSLLDKVSGYDEQLISEKLHIIFNNHSFSGVEKLALARQYLHTIKMSISLASLKNGLSLNKT